VLSSVPFVDPGAPVLLALAGVVRGVDWTRTDLRYLVPGVVSSREVILKSLGIRRSCINVGHL
jgi:hypothetical protein